MVPHLMYFLEYSKDPYVVFLKEKIDESLIIMDVDFQKYWNDLKKYFYENVDLSDGEVIF